MVILVLAVFFAEAVLLQVLCGAYGYGFGAHPDEAAHFVSSLLVRDYLAQGMHGNPLAFAREYYLHYPKVAIGHWPPMLYGLLGSWMLLAGASRLSALLFTALIAAGTATLMYRAAARAIGSWGGWLAGALFLALPLVQDSSARVMTEHLVTFFMLAATLAFAAFLRTERKRDGLAFGLLAAAAILTRGSAWALALVPPIAIVLTRRWSLLGRPGLWLSVLPIGIFCVPWYLMTRGMGEGSWAGGGGGFFARALIAFSGMIGASLGWALLVAAVVGLALTVIAPWRRRGVAPEWAALAALGAAAFLFQCAVPASIEERFMIAAMPSLLLFAVAGVDGAARRLPLRSPSLARAVVTLIVLAGFALETFTVSTRYADAGYESLVRQVLQRAPAARTYLVAADSRGEGSLVAAVALAQPRPQAIVLRGSKVLIHEDWLGHGTQDRYATVASVDSLLRGVPVDVVVVDDAMQASQRRPYHDRVESAARDSFWTALAPLPVTWLGRKHDAALHAYVRTDLLRTGATAAKAPDRQELQALVGEE